MAGGLGRHLDIDPVVVRVLLVVMCFFGGAGLWVYLALWLLVPEDGRERAPLRIGDDARQLVLVLALVAGGVILFGDMFLGYHAGFHGGWLVGLLAVAAAVVLLGRDRRPHAPPAPQPELGLDAVAPVAAGPTAPPPGRPQRTGIVWFWPTVALVAIGEGILGIVAANTSLPPAAYPALALAIIGAMTLVGAFFGRPGGMIALGLVATLVLGVVAVADATVGTRIRHLGVAPTSASSVQPAYRIRSGTIDLDLSQVTDPAALNGRQLDVSAYAGQVSVTLPPGMTVHVHGQVWYAGSIEVAGVQQSGFNPHVDTTIPGPPGAPTLDLVVNDHVGQIVVRQP